ncbi:MAG: hypothetical protein ACXW3Z_06355 [Limisphaerales bacterium]
MIWNSQEILSLLTATIEGEYENEFGKTTTFNFRDTLMNYHLMVTTDGEREDFAFETTLSGLTYIRLLKKWKAFGYRIEIMYLKLPSPNLAVSRIASRVKQGGHSVPKADVIRRFNRSWRNFVSIYRPLIRGLSTTMQAPNRLLWVAVMKKPNKRPYDLTEAAGRALRRSARVARMHGTPIYIWRDGKVVALKP